MKQMYVKRIAMSIIALALAGGMGAQTMEAVFTGMPDSYIPQLENAWRKDLVDLYRAGKEAKLKNVMEGYSSLEQLNDTYLRLRTTTRSVVEMKLLPLVNNTSVICMVTTVEGPVADSRLAFYTTDWQPLPLDDLIEPLAGEWYLKTDAPADQLDDARALLDMDLIRYDLHADNLTLTATYTTPLYLSEEDRERVEPCLAAPVVYEWRRAHFERKR